MKSETKLLVFSLAFFVAVAGVIITLLLTRSTIEPPPPPLPREDGRVIFTDFEVADVSSIFIVNQRDEGYSIHADLHTDDFYVIELNRQFPLELRRNIPYNQHSFSLAAQRVSSLSSATLVEERADNLEQYGLSLDNFAARVNVVFLGGTRLMFFIGNAVPNSADVYFRVENSNDVYTIRAGEAAPFLATRYEWLLRTAFPRFSPESDINRVTIERIDWANEGTAPMIIEVIETTGELDDLRSYNSHKLVSPTELELCNEASRPVIYGFTGLMAIDVVAVVPSDERLIQMGFIDEDGNPTPTAVITAEVAVPDAATDEEDTEIFALTIGGRLATADDNTVGWFGLSSHAPEVVYVFTADTLPWLTVSIENIHATAFLQPFIYSLEQLILETPSGGSGSSGSSGTGLNLEFTITGDLHSNRIYWENSDTGRLFLEGSNRDNNSDRGRFGELYIYIISARMDELFFEDTPHDSQLMARITYVFRDENTPNEVVEFYTAPDFRSIVRVNGRNIYKISERFTTRLISNIEAFASGRVIINDY
jgi:hypothetical protein